MMGSYLLEIPRTVVIAVLRFYQKTLSRDHGWAKIFSPYGHCKFYPSCSEYAIQAIQQKGLIRGAILALWRVLRCHPWSKGGNDPVV